MYISVYINTLVHWALPAQFIKWSGIWDLTGGPPPRGPSAGAPPQGHGAPRRAAPWGAPRQIFSVKEIHTRDNNP